MTLGNHVYFGWKINIKDHEAHLCLFVKFVFEAQQLEAGCWAWEGQDPAAFIAKWVDDDLLRTVGAVGSKPSAQLGFGYMERWVARSIVFSVLTGKVYYLAPVIEPKINRHQFTYFTHRNLKRPSERYADHLAEI